MSTAIECPSCGAAATGGPAPGGVFRCEFCGTEFVLEGQGSVVHATSPTRAAGTSRWVWLGVVGLAFGLGLWLGQPGGETAAKAPSPSPDVAPSAAGTPAPTRTARTPGTRAPAASDDEPTATFELHHVRPTTGGAFYVFGEVENTSKVPVGTVKVFVVLKDAEGHEVETRSGYVTRQRLAPGARAPFMTIVTKPPPYDHLEFEVVASKPSTFSLKQAEGLRLENDPPRRGSGTEWIFSGKIHNDGESPAHFAQVEVVARDAQHKIVGVSTGYGAGKKLEPGAWTRYEVRTVYPEPPASFEYSVRGRGE